MKGAYENVLKILGMLVKVLILFNIHMQKADWLIHGLFNDTVSTA